MNRTHEVLQKVAEFYESALAESERAQKYLTEPSPSGRALASTTIKSFQLGFSPQDGKMSFLSPEERKVLESVGHFDHKGLDRFRGRIILPVRAEIGPVSGFCGRILEKARHDKYINSTTSDVFRKGDFVYGLHHARRAIYERNLAIVAEGYLDVLAFHQSGTVHAIAPMGTHLTRDQLLRIGRYTMRIYLAFDADAGGDGAYARTRDLAKKMGFQVGRINIPRGQDPAEVLLK